MTILYVTEQGATLSRRRERLYVSKAGQELEHVHLADLDQVAVLGNVSVTSHALRAMLAKGVDLVIMNAGGSYLGRLASGAGRNIDLRRAQFRQLEDPPYALDLARRFVRAKLRNMRAFLGRHQRSHPNDALARAMVALRLSGERLEDADNLDTLLGHEGAGSAAYFGAFGRLMRAPGITFERRIRRPPPDPVNVLLSFGYTLLGNLVQGYVELAGLDPCLGALHRPEYGRPSLALDLIEEFRPVIVDTTVVRAINTQAITPRDFIVVADGSTPVEDRWEREDLELAGTTPPRPILFAPAGAKKWILAFERRLAETVLYPPTGEHIPYRRVLREQVWRLSRHIEGREQYAPFEYAV